MSIPVYLAVQKPEFIDYPGSLIAQTGCGLSADGKLRKPNVLLGGPVIIDDAVVLCWSPQALEELAALCQNGYIFDFERPAQGYHKELFRALPPEQLLGLPEDFYPSVNCGLPIISCPVLCNSWRQFSKAAGKRHSDGWMLEITPWHCQRKAPRESAEGILTQAVCRFRQKNGRITYYDTSETIKEKLKIAEQEGCRAGLALLEEVRNLA